MILTTLKKIADILSRKTTEKKKESPTETSKRFSMEQNMFGMHCAIEQSVHLLKDTSLMEIPTMK